MNTTHFKFWLHNAAAKFVQNKPEFWEKSFESGYWDLLNSPEQMGRHYLVAGLVREFFPSHANLLDVGCGYANILPLIKGAHFSYTGLDIAQAIIERCKTNYTNEKNLMFQQSSFESFQTNQKFDAIILNEVLYYLPLRLFSQIMTKVRDLMRNEKSVLILSMTQNPKAVLLRRWHFRNATPLRRLCVANLGGSGKWIVSLYQKAEVEKLRKSSTQLSITHILPRVIWKRFVAADSQK